MKEFKINNRVPDIIDFCGDPTDLYFLTCERGEDIYRFDRKIKCEAVKNKIYNTTSIIRSLNNYKFIDISRKIMPIRSRKYRDTRSIKKRAIRYTD